MKKIRILTAIGATIALVALTYRIGLPDIAAQFRNLRMVMPIVLLAGLARLFLQTQAWSVALRAEGIEVPQWRLMVIRLASQAAGYLTVGPVASEPAKLVLLRNPTGMAAAAPATLLETGAYWFTSAVLGLAGTGAAALVIADTGADTRAVWAAAALFGVAVGLLASRHSLLAPLIRVAGPRAPKWLRAAEESELRIRSFRDRQPQAARRVLALDAIAQLVTLVEVAAVLWSVGLRCSALHVLAIEAAGRIVKVLGAWIPGRIGADEGGAVVSFALLGLTPAAGLMLVVARRVRDLLCCAVGIVWMAKSSSERQAAPAVPAQVSLCMEER